MIVAMLRCGGLICWDGSWAALSCWRRRRWRGGGGGGGGTSDGRGWHAQQTDQILACDRIDTLYRFAQLEHVRERFGDWTRRARRSRLHRRSVAVLTGGVVVLIDIDEEKRKQMVELELRMRHGQVPEEDLLDGGPLEAGEHHAVEALGVRMASRVSRHRLRRRRERRNRRHEERDVGARDANHQVLELRRVQAIDQQMHETRRVVQSGHRSWCFAPHAQLSVLVKTIKQQLCMQVKIEKIYQKSKYNSDLLKTEKLNNFERFFCFFFKNE